MLTVTFSFAKLPFKFGSLCSECWVLSPVAFCMKISAEPVQKTSFLGSSAYKIWFRRPLWERPYFGVGYRLCLGQLSGKWLIAAALLCTTIIARVFKTEEQGGQTLVAVSQRHSNTSQVASSHFPFNSFSLSYMTTLRLDQLTTAKCWRLRGLPAPMPEWPAGDCHVQNPSLVHLLTGNSFAMCSTHAGSGCIHPCVCAVTIYIQMSVPSTAHRQ